MVSLLHWCFLSLPPSLPPFRQVLGWELKTNTYHIFFKNASPKKKNKKKSWYLGISRSGSHLEIGLSPDLPPKGGEACRLKYKAGSHKLLINMWVWAPVPFMKHESGLWLLPWRTDDLTCVWTTQPLDASLLSAPAVAWTGGLIPERRQGPPLPSTDNTQPWWVPPLPGPAELRPAFVTPPPPSSLGQGATAA